MQIVERTCKETTFITLFAKLADDRLMIFSLIKENIINLSSANFAKRVIKVVSLHVLSKAVLC